MRSRRLLLAAALAVGATDAAVLVTADGDDVPAPAPAADVEAEGDAPVEVAGPLTTLPPTTTAPPTTAPPTTAAPTTTIPPPPPPTVPPPPVEAPKASRFTIEPYRGLGVWVDVFDWSWSFTGGNPQVWPADIDRMASLGVRTLYIQASRYDHPADVVDLDLLQPLIDRAHARGMAVVGWYLPTLTDPAADLRRTLAMAALGIDGIGIDIESRAVADVADRNARLVAYAAAVRAALPGEVIGGIVLPPVLLEDVNPNYWPGFPWRELAPYYDVWQTMGYWTDRRAESGWRDGYAYTAANIDRLRANLGWYDAPVHPIGGIGDRTTPEQMAGMVQASSERGVLGGSIYDYRTTHDALWPTLQAFNG